MGKRAPLHLFEAVGVELEYMIVDDDTLAVRPLADQVLRAVSGAYEQEVELGPVAWSNELALHVIELKTNGPASTLAGLGATFQEHIRRINDVLGPMGARLLPTAMHPWMDPDRELRLWPHENDAIYQTFDRIFNCRGHGWANLQSVHLNLPFEGDEEFGRLHAAIRMILPVLPALAASSPYLDGHATGWLDTRLDVYRGNARRVPSVTGAIIPEPVFTRTEYEGKLLRGIYDELAPLDPSGVLRHEWVNARGCIARFDRMAIEIRIIDVQECPRADLAIAAAVTAAIRALVGESWTSYREQKQWAEHPLADILLAVARDGDRAVIEDRRYLASFAFPGRGPAQVRDLWTHLCDELRIARLDGGEWVDVLDVILQEGCLARRISNAVADDPSRDRLRSVYRRLAECLASGTLFRSSGAPSHEVAETLR